jgi:hypothetical protein
MPWLAEIGAALLDPERAVSAGLMRPERFAVYRNNVVVGLIEALAAAYPAVLALVGTRFFKAMAGVHVRAEPPKSPLLILYGAGFPSFIETFAPARRLPFLADVARLERLWLEAYHTAEAAPLPLDALARLPEPALAEARLALHPTVGLLASPHPVAALWAANTGRGEHRAVDLRRPETVLILRPRDRVEVHILEPGEAAFVGALSDGRSLAAAAEAALATEPSFALSSALGRIFAVGAVAGIDHPSDRSPDP